jgi:hypothetical protein
MVYAAELAQRAGRLRARLSIDIGSSSVGLRSPMATALA